MREFVAEQERLEHAPYSEAETQVEQTSEHSPKKPITPESEKKQSQPTQSSWNWDILA